MKNKFAAFRGDRRIGGTCPPSGIPREGGDLGHAYPVRTPAGLGRTGHAESEEVEFVRWFVLHFFTRDEEGGAWLLYDPANGDPLALAVGPFTPLPWAYTVSRARGLPGIAEVPIRFAPLLQEFGLNAIKWDGQAVVAVGQ
jgi:hypothetical protein